MESKKLIVTASPHITNHTSTRGLMLNVCIALLPALVASTLIFGAAGTAGHGRYCGGLCGLRSAVLRRDEKAGSGGGLLRRCHRHDPGFQPARDHSAVDRHHRRFRRHRGGKAAVRRSGLQFCKSRPVGTHRAVHRLCGPHDGLCLSPDGH